MASKSSRAEVFRLGTSRAGRPIEALRLSSAGDTADELPALAIVANPSGPRAFESALAVWLAEELDGRHDDNAAIADLLSRSAVWVLPAPHPDGLARRIESPATHRLGVGYGVDDDRDGRTGEDPPRDINGDGVIAQMRVPDPLGRWRAAEDDARRTVEADAAKGERGLWKLVPEGNDADGDGEIAEDAPHDTHLDKHYPAGWREHSKEAGQFPLDEPSTRAVADFFVARPQIALVVTYGDRDNLGEAPKGVKASSPGERVPPSGPIEDDAKLIAELGERYREITGTKKRTSETSEGSLQRWLYEHRGLLTLNAVLWEMPTKAPKEESEDSDEDGAGDAVRKESDADSDPDDTDTGDTETTPTASETSAPGVATESVTIQESLDGTLSSPAQEEVTEEPDEKSTAKSPKKPDKPSDEAGQLAWIDAVDPERFLPWTPFEHPELGAVEIGGLRPHTLREPPADSRLEIAEQQLEFIGTLTEVLPRLSIAHFRTTDLGAGIVRVEAALQNDGLLPLLLATAARARTVRPAHVTLELPDNAQLLAGRERQLVSSLAGSGGRIELDWLVKTSDPAGIALHIETDHAGKARASSSPAEGN